MFPLIICVVKNNATHQHQFNFMKLLSKQFLVLLVMSLLVQFSFAQVMDPSDPVVEYSGGNVAQPANGQVGDWVKTTRLNWNSNEYKCYIYKGNIFRLKFPKTYQHNVADGKTYPVMVFFHGLGESADENMYDNEYQLYHGGQLHMNAVNAGKFDGYLLYMQNQYGFFGATHFDALNEIVRNFLVPQNKVDINRILLNGLSAGGQACWEMAIRHPTLIAATLPISAALSSFQSSSDILKFIPIWHFQGGLDKNPNPGVSEALGASIIAAGGNYKYTKYPLLGHGCWTSAWAEPDFYPFMLRANKLNPIPLFGKYEFCPDENVNVTLGISTGFSGYRWSKDGVVMPGETSNTLVLNGTQAAKFGTYAVSVLRGSTWSAYSPNPVVVKLKAQTVTPVITTLGLLSRALPSPDGNTTVTMAQPEGYASYQWVREGSATVLSTTNTLTVNTTGSYKVRVTEQFGCSTDYSPLFNVVNANGPNKPDMPTQVIATAINLTSMKIDWTQNPHPDFNETNFEVYQATQAGGPYVMAGITGADQTSDTITGLVEGTKYYYIVRAINNTGASATTAEITGSTIADNQPPTTPQNFRITASTTNSATVAWNASTDNIGIQVYDIFINDVKSYVTTGTSFTLYNLSAAVGGYNFYVRARDINNNSSAASNIVYFMQPNPLPAGPAAPSAFTATTVSAKQVNLAWTDNATDETGYQILRSTNIATGYTIIALTGPNVTTWLDSNSLAANTRYFYRLNAVYKFGTTGYAGLPGASWKLDNGYTDASGNNKTLSGGGSPVFNATDKKEGTHSIQFNGTSQQAEINTATGDYARGTYNARTVSLWMKSTVNTGYRIAFDLGGSDNGIAIGIENNVLRAGIASNNIRKSISTPYSSNAWNFITVVYSVNSLKLYVNGVLAAQDLALGFNSVGATTNASRIGYFNGTNALNAGTLRFTGLMDDASVHTIALSERQILNLMNDATTAATTSIIPAKPAQATNLAATALSSSTTHITWSDNSNNETGFELYKSDNDNTNFVLLKGLPANTTSYTDNNLFANSVRYYKVRAINLGGDNGFSNEDSAQTWAYNPVVAPVTAKYMRIGTQLQVPVTATSPLNGAITLSATNLPAFASFTSNGGSGIITFNNPPAFGTYPDITITATDPFGSGSAAFQLVVNDNYSPELPAISPLSVNEGQTFPLNLAATDQNGADVLSWSFVGLPSFVTPVINGGNATLNITPGYADRGTYPVSVLVNDGNNGSITRSFVLTVNDVNPNQRVYVNFSGPGSPVAPAPWNSTNIMPNLNVIRANLLDQSGAATTVSLRVMSTWGSIGNGSNVLGVNTGNNSGVYPDPVMQTAWWTDVNNAQRIKIYGLDPAQKYTFTFFGSRTGVSDNRSTKYTLTGAEVSSTTLQAANNSQNLAFIQNVYPGNDTFELRLEKDAGSSFGYLNAMVIEKAFDDATAPAPARNVAVALTGGAAKLTWIDAAYNETSYEVYRSTQLDGDYSLVKAINPNVETYTDTTIYGNTTFFYTIKGLNANGSSYSDTVSITTGNGTPVLPAIANVAMRIQETLNIPINVTDDAGDVITFTATNLPPFATLTDNGNGQAILKLTPGSTIGIFNNITIKATDAAGAWTSRSFNVSVRDVFNSVYVNFANNTAYPAPAPWNSFTSVPFTNKALTNMVDDGGTATGISITQLTTWEGGNDQGATTGNNTGVFPDNVMKTVYYQSNTTPMRLRISGLTAPNTKYNLVFFASRLAGDVRNSVYTANGQSVTLNASSNTQNTVQLNGLTSDGTGNIEFSVTKGTGSPYSYLGAMVIQSYIDDGTPPAPANLVALATSKTAIRLTWADKSSDETGFDIERATSLAGPYTVIGTVGTDVTTYNDASGLTANTIYYYKVRGKKEGPVYSGYTNVASTSAYQYSVFINFNRSNNAAQPWNNTARAPEEGRVFSNLRNELWNQTGINMTIVDNFSGDNPDGMHTMNGSGIYPDNVLRSSWWVDANITAQLKISNLNQNMYYSFVFLGSRNGAGDRTSVYSIGTKKVSLNASFNTSQTVQIDRVRPNQNGEVYITVSLAQYAMYAYLNSLVINAYNIGETTSLEEPVDGGMPVANLTGKADPVPSGITDGPRASENGPALITNAGVYPNPFTNQLTVAATFEKSQENVSIRVTDMGGRTIFLQSYGNVRQGIWNQQVDLSGKSLKPGVYLLQVEGADRTKPPVVFKLIKAQ
ncbi:MAG: T9SS type A sorting domain-containing protein [Chitinophagaceae bacterium]|nr:MAG: T9SS type A sorting domain-containing protein [Chitinophagaceae bacterium]